MNEDDDDEQLTPEQRRERAVRDAFRRVGEGLQSQAQQSQQGAQLRAAQALADYDEQTLAPMRRRWGY